jgi:hypothetical protein
LLVAAVLETAQTKLAAVAAVVIAQEPPLW